MPPSFSTSWSHLPVLQHNESKCEWKRQRGPSCSRDRWDTPLLWNAVYRSGHRMLILLVYALNVGANGQS